MVSLAKDLEGKPVHIIASYCQRGSKESALASLKKVGWNEGMKNLTVMNQTGFPKAPIHYVPYYLVFDQNGKLQKTIWLVNFTEVMETTIKKSSWSF